jgi:hypothetical protein
MIDSSPAVPWNTSQLWREANASLEILLNRNRVALGGARNHSKRLRYLLEQIFPIMEDLCRKTCPTCTDICCRRAWVWVDFKDLLFFHLAGIVPPEAQLLGRQGDRCRYAGPRGCRLDRIQRPFVCIWYVCPEQARLLNARPTEKSALSDIFEQIKKYRRRMEADFIEADMENPTK